MHFELNIGRDHFLSILAVATNLTLFFAFPFILVVLLAVVLFDLVVFQHYLIDFGTVHISTSPKTKLVNEFYD